MCSVSAVSDYYMNTWPQRQGYPHNLPGYNPYQQMQPAMWPQQITTIQQADEETKAMLRRALELLDKVDKRLNDIDCMDEKKAAFLAAIAPLGEPKNTSGE